MHGAPERATASRAIPPAALAALAVAAIGGCSEPDPVKVPGPPPPEWRIEEMATSSRRWTGVAVTPDERVFVCFPRWSDDVPISVAEVDVRTQELRPYPDGRWNGWSNAVGAADRFVCVQSVHVDAKGRLLILDAASPSFAGTLPGAAKLVIVDPKRDRVIDTILLDATIAPPRSYLNDVRVDVARDVAYITDSGLGAIIVLDLRTGKARRVLERHKATKAEPRFELEIGDGVWVIEGEPPRIHADGLAISPDGVHLYFQALTGKTLYRVPTAALRDEGLPPNVLAAQVAEVAKVGASDGIEFGPDDRLWLTSLEHDAIRGWDETRGVQTIVKDERLVWPDSMAVGPGERVWVTTARIHEGDRPKKPFGLYRIEFR